MSSIADRFLSSCLSLSPHRFTMLRQIDASTRSKGNTSHPVFSSITGNQASVVNAIVGIEKLKITDKPHIVSPSNEDAPTDSTNHATNVETEVIDWEKERKEMDKIFEQQARDKLKYLPQMVMPHQFRNDVVLFQHQKDGIRWLVNQENNPPPSPFYRESTREDGSKRYYSRLNFGKRMPKPAPLSGSVLADEMGLVRPYFC